MISNSEISPIRQLVEQLDEVLERLDLAVRDHLKRALESGRLREALSFLLDALLLCKSSVLKAVMCELVFRHLGLSSLKVAALGPEGTFTHDVAVKLFGREGVVLYSSIRDVIRAVRDNIVPFGLVPLENSLEGIIHETLDCLEETDSVFINLCIERRVNFCIAASSDVTSLVDIETLYVNPYAYTQCRENVTKLLRSLKRIVYVSSTAESAKAVAESSRAACLVSRSCAELYGLKVLAEHVEDRESYTRFALISRVLLLRGDRTGIIFTISHRPGALYRVLEVFAKRSINLTMIYSRPTRKKPWQYYFYLEFEGSLTEELYRELSQLCHTLRPLGSYVSLSLDESKFLSSH